MLHKTVLLKKALIFSAFFYVLLFVLGTKDVFALNCPAQHIDESARVKYVYDGDTIQLDDGRKIRLIGIDTPEVFSKHRQIPVKIQMAGEHAKAALSNILKQSNGRLGLKHGAERQDRYQRNLAHIYLPNGTNIQAKLIEAGHAIAFTTPPNEVMSRCYMKAEAAARGNKRGIWQLKPYQLKPVNKLTHASNGFHRLSGKVTSVKQRKKSISLFLDDVVELKINKKDLPYFNTYMLNNIKGKQIQVRGWLHFNKPSKNSRNKGRYRINLRHSNAIKVIN